MEKRVKWGLPLGLLVILVLTAFSARSMMNVGNYGKLINYVGIVRGASQRIVKLETNGRPSDDLILYVSDILEELECGNGQFGLKRIDFDVFYSDLHSLKEQWSIIKDEIRKVRIGEDPSALLSASEDFFVLANETVFSIEEHSGARSSSLARQLVVTAAFCLLISILAVIYSVRKYFELHRKAELLAQQTGRDELTGALNLERFRTEAQERIDQNPSLKFAVLYIDFENFKYINDVFGYASGNQMLKKYTELMTASMDKNELFARDVADCFLVLRCYEEKDEMLSRQEEIDRAFLELDALPDRHNITIACGFCCIEDVIEQLDVQGLVTRANYARKTVKSRPDKHYAFYDESIRQRMFEEIKIADRMESALAGHEFLVYFQPKVSPEDGRVCAAEALVRWRQPDGSLYMPGTFIPVFEKNHCIGLLDQYVFEEVCRFLKKRIEAGLPIVPVSVNVSKIRFYTPGFVETYAQIKRNYSIPDGILEIEFTETVACENPDYMIQISHELHRHGFFCSLDDFGTGYSSLGMLKDMPIDVLKLDAMFFKKTADLQKEQTIIRGVLQLIRELDIRTVAEGIETADQAAFLRESGCDLIQGYYFYKPMPEADFSRLLGEARR